MLETTLAGKGAIALMDQARQAGYRLSLIYIALADPELHIERVRLRVSLGGHDVPDSDIRRRFGRSLRHVPEAVRLAHEAVLLDNSAARPQRVLTATNGQVIWCVKPTPQWVEHILTQMTDSGRSSFPTG